MRGLKLKLSAVLMTGIMLSGCAPGGADDGNAGGTKFSELSAENPTQIVYDAIKGMGPEGYEPTVDWLRPSPMPGFHEVVVDGDFLLVSDDGRYVIKGDAKDLHTGLDIGDAALSAVRKRLLAENAPAEDRIVFAPKNPKHTVTVLTDISCGYCRRLHSQIAEYNQRGIAIEYIAYPRMGLGSDNDREMQSIWCATDRRKALTDAKNGKPVEMLSCNNPVESQYRLGQRLGLQGTPMMITASGSVIHGYLPPEMLEERLAALMGEGNNG